MGIYDEFMRKVKSASHAETLGIFMEKLCAKMGAVAKFDKNVLETMRRNDADVLQVLRDETQLVIWLMREEIEKRKAMRGGKEGESYVFDDIF